MQFRCLDDLAGEWRRTRQAPDLALSPDLPPAGQTGDITLNCFRLAKALRANPVALAGEAEEFLGTHADVAEAQAVKAFVNVTLTPAALFRDTVADEAAVFDQIALPAAEQQRRLVEYSAPNTNKPQHLGHVRNNTLGLAICSVLARVGHTVAPVNLVNDRGIHICKSMLSYQRHGDGATPATSGLKGDHLVGEYYVKFEGELRQQLADLRQASPELAEKTDDELFGETEIGVAAQEMLRAWEQDDPATRKLWRTLNDWVLAGFEQTYKRMGVSFERTYYESDTYRHGKDEIIAGLDRGVFGKRPDGAVEIDLDDVKLGRKVVLRADGTSVYVTQDIGTTIRKHRDFQPDAMTWITGDEQIHHFKVLFAILAKLGYDWTDGLHHLSYGMVNLPSGRMKSREGTVVDADELFDEMFRLARTETLKRYPDGPPADLELRAETIAMGALKFMLLKVSPKTTIAFDPNASMKFEGDTGPYVQYAYARISSIFRKEAEHELADAPDWTLLGEPEERELALRCALYGRVLRRAAAELDASGLANYALDLAKAFSRFYRQHSVLSAPTPELRRTRLELCRRVRDVLKDALEVLTIDVLESM